MFDIKPNIKLFKNISIYLVLIIMTLSTITYIKIKLEGRYRQDNISNSSLSDYQFKGTDAIIEDPDGNLVYEINNIIVTEIDGESTQYNTKMYHIDNYKRGYLSINFDYNCLSTVSHEKLEVLLLPKNAYTGYSFYIDGKKEDFVRAENGRPFIAIKGDKGHVNFKFENNIRWTIAFIISIITLFICIIKRLYKEIKSIKIFIKNSRGKKYE